jgi:uncharacterized protein
MKLILLMIIRMYKRIVSPLLPKACRFEPSCSSYALESIQKHGWIKGCYLSVIRLLKCQPLHPGGYDPVR